MAYLKTLLLLVLHYNSFSSAEVFRECLRGLNTCGYTYPEGDITLKWGQDLNITCVLNSKGISQYGPNASDLMRFMVGDHVAPSEKINGSAIRLTIMNHTPTKMMQYFCMVNESLVCTNIVAVGTPPQEVTNFSCMGQNLETFTCSFIAPDNYIHTDYKMDYYVPSAIRYKDKSKHKHEVTTPISSEKAYYCPKNLTAVEKSENVFEYSCTWGLSTIPQYRHSQEFLTFRLNYSNTFGNKTSEFTVNQYQRVRANSPENLTGMTSSPHSIKLKWAIPLYIQTFPKHLTLRVSWWIEEFKNWTTVYFNTTKQYTIYEYTLTNLPYAHCLYDIRVAIKVTPAIDEDMWSQNSSINLWTQPKAPDRPPSTTAGLFELLPGTGNRRIFWQNIHNYEENGNNFSHYIEIQGHPDIRPIKIQNNFAEFTALPDENYTFNIWSQNNVSRSAEASSVFFPAQKYMLKPLATLVKIDKGSGEYGVEWSESNDPRLTHYTLFWCSAQNEWPHPCDGVLSWKEIPRDVKNTSLKLPTYNMQKNQSINIYQFAISANAIDTSSGMLWAHCTILPGAGVKLSQTYVKKVESRSIVLQWKFECIKLRDTLSFNVSYCRIAALQPQVCQPNTEEYRLFNNTDNKFGISEGELVITGLKPYSTYKTAIKPIINDANSQFGEPMFNNTAEDIPTEPQNLQITNITDKQMTIKWEKPLEENGHLRYYKIYMNGVKQLTIDAIKDKQVYVETVAVRPRTTYNISVCVYTIACSNFSTVFATSDIGIPGGSYKPSFNWERNDIVIVKWDKPDEAYGKIDFYQVEVGLKNQVNTSTVNATEPLHRIEICKVDKSQNVYIKVRGVNIKNNQFLYGPWSVTTHIPCTVSSSSLTWIIPLVVMTTGFLLALIWYFSKNTCNKVVGMQNCPVKLPTDMDHVIDTETKEKNMDETLPGEPLLPEKQPKGGTQNKDTQRNPSGESSGCCSGTESISSGESAGHLSISDSGTDQPRSPSLPESEANIRQRLKKPDYVTETLMPWSSNPRPEGYSVVGLRNPPIQSESEADYLPLSDVSSVSSFLPVMQPQALKPTTPGYVPCLSQEPAAKNTAYVVAGEPTPARLPPMLSFKEDDSKEPSLESPKSLITWEQDTLVEMPARNYVVVGDSKPLNTDIAAQNTPSKGYVSHLTFDTAKSLKED
ncbi:cytokine receptor isoform X1 [Euwallacea fornicatus]|uniref:cytokine receptor isoform X1 n=1 Tax=Euwallacea fornicatus TaxID=995702 RepID=UPI00338FE714